MAKYKLHIIITNMQWKKGVTWARVGSALKITFGFYKVSHLFHTIHMAAPIYL